MTAAELQELDNAAEKSWADGGGQGSHSQHQPTTSGSGHAAGQAASSPSLGPTGTGSTSSGGVSSPPAAYTSPFAVALGAAVVAAGGAQVGDQGQGSKEQRDAQCEEDCSSRGTGPRGTPPSATASPHTTTTASTQPAHKDRGTASSSPGTRSNFFNFSFDRSSGSAQAAAAAAAARAKVSGGLAGLAVGASTRLACSKPPTGASKLGAGGVEPGTSSNAVQRGSLLQAWVPLSPRHASKSEGPRVSGASGSNSSGPRLPSSTGPAPVQSSGGGGSSGSASKH